MTTVLQSNPNMYNTNYDIVTDIKILGDLNNKLFCTFTDLEGLELLIEDIKSKYDIIYNKLFVLEIVGKDEYVVTYNVDQTNLNSIPDNTILVHRKKESNTLYTINALNELIKKLNGGVVDTNYKVDWQHYRNCILLTQHNEQGGQKTDYTTIFWRPTVGKQQIRIVPSTYDSSNPFTELKFYYGITNKVMISPANFGDKDPIALFAGKLREGEYNKENYVLAKKLDAKNRVFVPVVVRGEEDKGVRLWQFGKTVYEELLALAVDEEIGDYTDIVNGRDLTVETVGPESTGTPYNKSSVRVRLKTSPLSEDASLVEKWCNEQPNPKDGLFKRYSFDEMKSALEKWLSPEDESEDEIPAPVVESKPSKVPASTFKSSTAPAKLLLINSFKDGYFILNV